MNILSTSGLCFRFTKELDYNIVLKCILSFKDECQICIVFVTEPKCDRIMFLKHDVQFIKENRASQRNRSSE
jgi:hypothetical protein